MFLCRLQCFIHTRINIFFNFNKIILRRLSCFLLNRNPNIITSKYKNSNPNKISFLSFSSYRCLSVLFLSILFVLLNINSCFCSLWCLIFNTVQPLPRDTTFLLYIIPQINFILFYCTKKVIFVILSCT